MYVIIFMDYDGHILGYLNDSLDCRGLTIAKTFPTEGEAIFYLNNYEDCEIIKLTDQQYKSILRHRLRVRAKELFGLKANSPMYVIADRYEDEGMLEEANLLR